MDKKNKIYKSKRKLGQFFTCPNLVERIINIFNINFDNKSILEPSFGDSVFVNYINNHFCPKNFTAIDIDRKMCNKICNKNSKVNIVCSDFLKFNTSQKYDIIIGNPPFNLKTNKKYCDSTEGFVKKSLSLLKEKGVLYFVLPSTILRNQKYQNLRKQIISKYKILGIINSSKFDFSGANIETIVIGIEKSKVIKQKYFYIDGNRTKYISLDSNERWNILLDNKQTYYQILKSNKTIALNEIFEIKRGHSKTRKINGRSINFYSWTCTNINKITPLIGLQNVAYRLTSNVIFAESKDISDTVTILKPKRKIQLSRLVFISEYLNSSIANYFLHTNSLNNSKLTIHIDWYYIYDLPIPKYDPNFVKKIQNAKSKINKIEFAKLRNDYFIKLFKLNKQQILQINQYWTYPRVTRKGKI